MFVSDLLNLSHFCRLWRVEGQPWAEMWYWSSSTTSSMGAWHRQVQKNWFETLTGGHHPKDWDRTGMYEKHGASWISTWINKATSHRFSNGSGGWVANSQFRKHDETDRQIRVEVIPHHERTIFL